MITYDTETCGLHGMAVLIQYALDDGPVVLFSPWTNPIQETLDLIKWMMEHPGGVVGFNLAYDHFHLCKLFTVFSLYPDKSALPIDIIDELAELEMLARDGDCLKPVKACDIMLHARKGPYQSTMDRGDIRIRKVPTPLAWLLAAELERRIKLKDIYFARKKDKNQPKWSVYDITNDGEMDPNFKDVVLKFAPSSALKALAVDALGLPPDDVLLFLDIEVDPNWYPEELGFAPFAKALGGSRHDWKGAWPAKIHHHIDHWNYHSPAREYASKDVIYARDLYKHFGSPELGDDDSELACMVAAVRWRGFKLDLPKLEMLRQKAITKIANTPTAPGPVRAYVLDLLGPTERLVISSRYKAGSGSTKMTILEEISRLKVVCPDCNTDATVDMSDFPVHPTLVEEFDAPELVVKFTTSKGRENCPKCKGSGQILHPAASRANEVIEARKATKEKENYDKLLIAGRFHASFKVIGALSSRMSGSDGLNPQGIKHDFEVRSCFPLAWNGFTLCGGDFSGFEVTLAEACYNDPLLRQDLLTCEKCDGRMIHVGEPITAKNFFEQNESSFNIPPIIDPGKILENNFYCTCCGSSDGKKIHALFGVHVFPDLTYAEIKANKDIYTRCKQAVFAILYGGEGPTLQDRLGVDLDTANQAFERFTRRYRRVGVERKKIFDMFCSMRQPGGIGSKVEWHEPLDYIASMFGFKRYFTLENQICRALFDLSNQPPKSWRDVKIQVQRRDRVQTASGAAQSALYAAAFNLQASNMRAAANHVIQSSGSQITKRVQRRIWDVQPFGVNEWLVQPINNHDEIMSPCALHVADRVKQIVNSTVEEFRTTVPLIRMDWAIGLNSWAEKG